MTKTQETTTHTQEPANAISPDPPTDRTGKVFIDLLTSQVVFRTTFRRLLTGKRLAAYLFLFALPWLIAGALFLRKVAGRDLSFEHGTNEAIEFFVDISFQIYTLMLIPLCAAIITSTTMSDEIEDRTLVYLLSSPIHRAEIVVSKFLATVFGTFILSTPGLVVNYLLLGSFAGTDKIIENAGICGAMMLINFLCIVALTGLFMFVSVTVPRPTIATVMWGLGYEFFGGLILPVLFRGTRWFFASAYARALVAWASELVLGAPPEDIPNYLDVSAFTAGVVLVALGLVGLVAAMFAIDRKDFP